MSDSVSKLGSLMLGSPSGRSTCSALVEICSCQKNHVLQFCLQETFPTPVTVQRTSGVVEAELFSLGIQGSHRCVGKVSELILWFHKVRESSENLKFG